MQAVFATIPMTIYTIVTVGLLALRKHVRAALWTVGVMLAAGLSTYFLKGLLHRDRPVWSEPVTTLKSYSFPSGHATGIAAAAGVMIVLTLVFVRRRQLRRLLVATALAVALLVGSGPDLPRCAQHHRRARRLRGGRRSGCWSDSSSTRRWPRPKPLEAFTTPVPTSRQLAVILNPIKVEDAVAFRAMVEQRAAETGWGSRPGTPPPSRTPAARWPSRPRSPGAEIVIVCGGDGTVRTVCAELAGTGISVGIIPAGTGNLLARNLGIPLQFQAAVDVALQGQDRAIDMVKVTGDGIGDDEHFMVMAGMGFDAAIMEGANEQIKAKVGWLAYVVSGMRNIMFPAVRLDIRVDDGEWTRHRARTIVIGNVGYLQAGMPLLPDAAIDDGVLDVVLLHPSRFLSWIPLAVRVISRGKRTDDLVNRMTGRTVERHVPRRHPAPARRRPDRCRPRAARRVRARPAAGARAALSAQAGVSSKTGIVRPELASVRSAYSR